jgi:hypothetical protein
VVLNRCGRNRQDVYLIRRERYRVPDHGNCPGIGVPRMLQRR